MIVLALLALVSILILGNIVLGFTRKKLASLLFNTLLLMAIACFSLMLWVGNISAQYFKLVNVSPFGAFFASLSSLGLLLVGLLAYAYSDSYPDFALLASFALAGALSISFAGSLLMLLAGLELVSLPSVFIVLFSRRNSIEAATKFFLMSAFVAGLLVFAIVLTLGSAGTLSFSSIKLSAYASLALVLFFASLGFDSSIFPFNILIPDIYQGSSSYATGMLGSVNKSIAFAALIQVIIFLFIGMQAAFGLAALLAALTMFYGNLVALVQTDLKRLFAYSSIAQAGYILIGIATATSSGIAASLVQIFAHAFLFIGVLAILAWLEKNGRKEVDSLIGLSGENKLAAFAFTIFVLSMIGLPLTTGFVGKLLLFMNAATSGLLWLALLGIINTIISIFYYAKIVVGIFTSKVGERKIRMEIPTMAVVVSCLVITFLFGIYPSALVNFATNAAASIL